MPHKDAAGRWISDDGLYVWNGGAWVPHSAPPTIAPPDEQQVEAQTDEVRGQAKQPESLIVPWALGTMTLESNALVLGMNIQEGIFRKKRSHVERRIPLGDIQAVRARESDKALEVVFRDGTFEGFQGCESLELLSRFLEGLPDSINVEAAIEDTGAVFDAIGVTRPSARSEVRVKSYKNEREFQHDAQLMMNQGWTMAGQSSKERKTAIIRNAGKAVATGLIGLAILGRSQKAIR